MTVVSSFARDAWFIEQSYGQTKLTQIMFIRTVQTYLNEKSLMVNCYAVHPDEVRTEIFNEPFVGRKFSWFLRRMKVIIIVIILHISGTLDCSNVSYF